MARIYQLLIVLLLVALLAPAGTALAQNGACPPGSFQLTGPGGPVGTVPHDMLVCAYDAYDHVAALDDPHDYYPCDQVVYHYEPDLQWLNQTLVHSFNWVPPTDYHYGQFIRVRFLVFQYMSVASSPDLIWSFDSYELQLQMYDSALRETSNQIRQLGQFQKVTTFRVVSDFFGTHRYYYDVYVVDLYIYQGDSAEPRGGYLRLRLHPRPDEQNPNPLSPNLLGWAMSSMQFGNADDVFPEHCPIPNATLPIIPPVATPTAYPPTWTPVPGATTAPTPMTTPWPTATGLATAYPTYTPTPLIFPTTQSEITPTPWQPVTLPTIAWPTPKPTILWAGLPGGGEGGEGGEGGGGVGGALLEMLDGVKDSLEAPTGELQELASLDAWTPTEPGDGPLTLSPDNTLFEMVSLVTLPFSYLMGLRALMPNLAPWLTFFVSLAGLVIFQVVIKLALNAATFTFELIRRIWEAIPLN